MDIPKLIKRWFVKEEVSQEVPVQAPVELTTIQVPPILVRLENQNHGDEGETNRLFIQYGWRRGSASHLAETIDQCVYACVNGPGEWKTTKVSGLSVDPWLKLRVVQILEHENFVYVGKPWLALFMPAGAEVKDAPIYSHLSGGISSEFNEMLKLIAFRLRAKITTIETDLDGSTLVLFKAWDNNYSLRQFVGADTEQTKE